MELKQSRTTPTPLSMSKLMMLQMKAHIRAAIVLPAISANRTMPLHIEREKDSPPRHYYLTQLRIIFSLFFTPSLFYRGLI